MPKVQSLCWWLANNGAAFVDAHDASGELVRFGFDHPSIITFPAQPDKGAAQESARFLVHHIAQFFGAEEVVHDRDSEEDLYDATETN